MRCVLGDLRYGLDGVCVGVEDGDLVFVDRSGVVVWLIGSVKDVVVEGF